MTLQLTGLINSDHLNEHSIKQIRNAADKMDYGRGGTNVALVVSTARAYADLLDVLLEIRA